MAKFKILHTRYFKKLLAVLLVLVIFAGVATRFLTKDAAAAWFDDNWGYRKAITFTHNAAVSNTQVEFDIDTTEAPEKFQADCGDVRFTDANGQVLKYYYDSGAGACDTSSTDFDVLIPNIVNGSNLIYMYYGNPSVVNGTEAADFTVTTTTPSGGAGSAASEEKGPTPYVWWRFDDGTGTTAQDSGSANKDATLAASTATPTWQNEDQCVSGKCLRFDGSDDYASAANIDLSGTDVITVEFWMKWNSYTNDDDVAMEFSSNYNSVNTGFIINPNESGGGMFNVSFKSTEGNNKIDFTRPSANDWHHYAFVINRSAAQNSRIIPYVDGQVVAYSSTQTGVVTGSFASDTLYFMSRAGSSLFGKGDLDGVKIYKYERSVAQIKASYNSVTSEGGNVLGSASQEFLSEGLVGYWKMDESSANTCTGGSNDSCDSSGNGADGAWSDGATTTAGKFGNGVSFDGTDDLVSVAYSATQAPTSAISFGGWFEVDDKTQDIRIISKTQSGGWNLGFNDTIAGSLTGVVNVGGSYYYVSFSNSTIANNTWYHAFVTYDGETLRLYLNGVQVDSNAAPSGQVNYTLSNNLCIGGEAGTTTCTSTNEWDGTLDDIRLYNRAFSPDEVSKLYNWAPGPVGYWKMDEKSGTSASDSSGNGNVGTWNGSGNHFATGKVGSAGNFDGSSDYISAGNPTNLQITADITMSAWINPSAINGSKYYPIIAKRHSDTVNGYELYLSNDNNGYLGYYTNGTEFKSTYAVPLNKWTYVTATVINGTVTLYANGIPVYTNTGATPTVANGDFHIGFGLAAELTYVFAGKIDDAKVYNYARSAKQVIEDMNGGHPTGGSPVGSQVAYWDMDTGYGTTAADRTQNRNDLTLSSASWTKSGKIGGAWNGTGSVWLSRADDDDLDFGASEDFSLSQWVKSDSASNPGANQFIVTKQTATNNAGYRMYFNTSGQIVCDIDDDTTSYPEDSATTTIDYYDATWHHVVCSRNITSGTLDLFVDGKRVAQDTSLSATGSLANSSTFYVGDDDGDSTNSFAGDIDEVKVYRSALIVSEIQIDMNRNASQVLGSSGDNATAGSAQAAGQEYCVPGDSTSCTGPTSEFKFQAGQGSTVYDSGSAVLNGTWSGTGSHWTKGRIGKAAYFDGSTDYINSFSSSISAVGSRTICLWANSLDPTRRQGFLGTRPTVANQGFVFHLNGANTVRYFHTGGSTLSVSTTVNANEWYHWCVSYNSGSSTAIIYKNGVVIGTGTSFGSETGSSFTGIIGDEQEGGSSERFKGSIDDLRIYNYVRTPAQIAWEYNKGLPIAHWDMDECQGASAYDRSGNGNTGTITIGGSGTQTGTIGNCTTSATTPRYTGSSGKYNAAINFDGTDDRVSLGNQSLFTVGTSVTYSAWVYPTAAQGGMFFAKWASGSEDKALQMYADRTVGFYLHNTFGGAALQTTTTIPLNQWSHVVGVYDGSTAKIYINGKQEASKSASGDVADSTGIMYLGGNPDRIGTEQYLQGKLDDARIYNYPLTAVQVKNLYNGGAVRFGPASGTP